MTIEASMQEARARKPSQLIMVSRTKLFILARQLREATSIKSGCLDIWSCKDVARNLEEVARQTFGPPDLTHSLLRMIPIAAPKSARCDDTLHIAGNGDKDLLNDYDNATFEFIVRRKFGIRTPGASSVLAMLIRSHNKLCTIQQICSRIHCQDGSLKVFMCQLRADLEELGLAQYIVTVRKSRKNKDGGYFIAPEHQAKFTDILATQLQSGEHL